MTFPVVEAVATYSSAGGSFASHELNLPAGVQTGELLLLQFGASNAAGNEQPTLTPPTGWTAIVNEGFTSGGRRPHHLVAYRVADGTEGSTVTVTTGVATGAGGTIARISGHDSSRPPTASTSSGSTGHADPPSHDAGAEDDILWWPSGASSTTEWQAAPTDYGNFIALTPTVSQGRFGSARRELRTQTEDPGVFTLSATNREWRASTVAIYPADAGPPGDVTFSGTSQTVTTGSGALASNPPGQVTGLTITVGSS